MCFNKSSQKENQCQVKCAKNLMKMGNKNQQFHDLESFNLLSLSEQEKILVKARLLTLKNLDKIDRRLAIVRSGKNKDI